MGSGVRKYWSFDCSGNFQHTSRARQKRLSAGGFLAGSKNKTPAFAGVFRLAERLGCNPPEGWTLHLSRMPHGPIILLLCNAGILRHRLSFRPACQVIQGIDCGRRTSQKPRRSVRMAKRPKIEQHRHGSPGLASMDEGPAYERISEPMCAIGRVCDNVLGKGRVRF